MSASAFLAFLKTLTAVPAGRRAELEGLADGLTDDQRKAIAQHLETLNTALLRNTEHQEGLVTRAGAMLTQVAEHDFPAIGLDPHA